MLLPITGLAQARYEKTRKDEMPDRVLLKIKGATQISATLMNQEASSHGIKPKNKKESVKCARLAASCILLR